MTPQLHFGPLLATVQERGLLGDGKTFVDCVPKRPVAEIMAGFERLGKDDEDLLDFVAANFDLPNSIDPYVPTIPLPPLRAHIRALWPRLARDPGQVAPNSSALPVRHRHVVPGGRFRELYYWDSFFTMLGLVRDGEMELANGIVDALTDLVEAHGHIPNGARSYYLGRSQPPLYYMMVALLADDRPAVVARRIAAMKREHDWWTKGADGLASGEQRMHVARLADGSFLNRYWDPHGTPRDESWREDVETAAQGNRPHPDIFRDLRAGAESGWDFSSRWLDGPDLASIRTTAIAPVDLNAFLYGLECAIASAPGEDAPAYAELAGRRRQAMHKHLWFEKGGYFADYDLRSGTVRPGPSAAALAPLLCGVATRHQADATARLTANHLVGPGGLRTTLIESGQQWDAPNCWGPLQWIAVAGLRRYGHGDLAREIAERWVATVNTAYSISGLLHEKYDVEALSIGGGGEYAPQIGFGWTNGVTADLMDFYGWNPEVSANEAEAGIEEQA